MIKVEDLEYEFELKINKIAREDNQNITLGNKIIFFNMAQMTWIKSKLNQNNIFKIGYEGFRKRIDDLQVLKINNHKLSTSKTDNLRYLGYKTSIDFPEYMFYISGYATATHGKCKDTVSINLIKEGELETLYYDSNYKPSFKWRETIATVGNNNLYVYSDSDFTINNVYLTYLRKPKLIDKQGYIKLDGTDLIDQDCELPEYAKNDIVDLAVKFAAQSTDNTLQVQMTKERENNNE